MQNFKLSTAQVKLHQICTLIGSFRWKYTQFQLKKYKGVMFHDTEVLCEIWRKTVLLFQKWQEFGELWSEHSKVSKICTLISSFRAKHITFDLKSTEELSTVILKSYAKFEEKLMWFGKWHEEFVIFSSENLWSVKIDTFMASFCPKLKM